MTLDPELAEITLRSLHVTVTEVLIAAAFGLPLGAWLAINRFRGRRHVIAVPNALMGLPPVVVGLVVCVLLSRSSPRSRIRRSAGFDPDTMICCSRRTPPAASAWPPCRGTGAARC